MQAGPSAGQFSHLKMTWPVSEANALHFTSAHRALGTLGFLAGAGENSFELLDLGGSPANLAK